MSTSSNQSPPSGPPAERLSTWPGVGGVADSDHLARLRWSDPEDRDVFEVHDPATGRLLHRVSGAGPAQVDGAVAAARTAFTDVWRDTGPAERAEALRHAARLVREHADEVATIESREMGKPWEIARRYDLEMCVASFEFFAGQAHGLHGEYFPGGPVDTWVVPEPYGVVAGIVPFNWPPIHTGAKAAAALAAGNSVILKPPEQCPFTVLRLVEIISEALPDPAVLQALPGTGGVAGAHLVAHPGVDRLSFTGSPGTARRVLHAAAENLTGALLELGGKNPLLVLNDADLDVAVAAAVEAGFFNNGEACTAGSRILVHNDVADEFVARYVAATARLTVGDPLVEGTHVGPMVTETHRQRVRSYIDCGTREGAVLVHRSATPADPTLAAGYWVPPTIFDHVTPTMRIAQEEIFGPVSTVTRFEDERDAVDIANSTEFALVAGIFSRDEARARRLAGRVDAGVVFINNFSRRFLPTPFGGNRASGYGREHAAETMREYLRSKSVRVPSGRRPMPTWSGTRPV